MNLTATPQHQTGVAGTGSMITPPSAYSAEHCERTHAGERRAEPNHRAANQRWSGAEPGTTMPQSSDWHGTYMRPEP